jgi:hypothetical protein
MDIERSTERRGWVTYTSCWYEPLKTRVEVDGHVVRRPVARMATLAVRHGNFTV